MLFLNLSAMALSKTLMLCGLSLANAEKSLVANDAVLSHRGQCPLFFNGTNTVNREVRLLQGFYLQLVR